MPASRVIIENESNVRVCLIGTPGLTGKSAYQEAVVAGFTGTPEEWLESIRGERATDHSLLLNLDADSHPQYLTEERSKALHYTKSQSDASWQQALDELNASLLLKAPKESPAFTGIPTAPTAVPGTNTTQLSTTAFVQSAIANLKNGVAADGDDLNKIWTKVQAINSLVGGSMPDGNSTVDTVAEVLAVMADFPEGLNVLTTLNSKSSKSANLSDLTDKPLAVSTLGFVTNGNGAQFLANDFTYKTIDLSGYAPVSNPAFTGSMAISGGDVAVIQQSGGSFSEFRQLTGTVDLRIGSSTSYGYIATMSNHLLAFFVNSSVRAQILPNGYFGINSDPNRRFEVRDIAAQMRASYSDSIWSDIYTTPTATKFINSGMKYEFDNPVQLPSVADADAPNNTIYFSTDSSKLAFKDGSGTKHDLY